MERFQILLHASMRCMVVPVIGLLGISCFAFVWLLHIQKHRGLREI